LSWKEEAKKRVAAEAVGHVKNGYIVGLGSGSTVAYAISNLSRKIKEEKLDVLCVPSSYQSSFIAVKEKIPLTTLDEYPILDLAIDGADQIDKKLNLIKGEGAALAREKIVASSAKKLIIIADETKLTANLGLDHHVPIEVLPFGAKFVLNRILKSGWKATLREGKGKVGPVITDNGNFIIDADFGIIKDPRELEMKLKNIPGIVETGLFIGMVDLAYIGTKAGKIQKLEKK
jgi:ribose 5-phosphate isomerase A